MRVLLRDLGGGLPSEPVEGGPRVSLGDKGKVVVELAGVPREGEELHWSNWIAKVHKTMWLPACTDVPKRLRIVACCYVVKP